MFKISYIYDLVDQISPQLKKIQSNLESTRSKTQAVSVSMSSSLNQVIGKLDSVGTKFTKFGKEMFFKATLPLSILAGSFIKAASDYSESINKVDVAFGTASQSVKDFAVIAGKDFGIDRGTALDMAAMFGDMSTSMGISQGKAAELSTSLVGLAGDLASFKNLNISEVQTALAGIFTGETESLKRLGVVMTEENLNQFLLTQGIAKKMKDLTQAQKVLQRYNYVLQMTSNSHGDFVRTQAGFANQMRIASSAYKDLSIQLGTALLPYATQFLGVLIKAVQYFQQLTPATQKTILIIGAILAILPPLIVVFGSLILAVKGLFIGLSVLMVGFALLFNPIGLVTVGVIALIAIMRSLKDSFAIVYNYLKDNVLSIFDAIASKIGLVTDKINKFRSDAASILSFAGFDSAANFVAPEINQELNTQQSLTAGGQLDVNIKGLPKGSSAGFTPKPNSFLPVGLNTVYGG